MIPQSITLKGFLCYREEQTIEFDSNATLWMLSGLNGSGKSAIFDAVTYALFGHHRGGGQQAVELINKDSDTLIVQFDFLLDGVSHRARRTLRRDNRGGARGTQQMYRQIEGKWEPIEETGQKREFDAWIAEHIGLSYETFTSSVLLLQGKAEKLLDSKPEGRREVLAGIVNLDRYKRLFELADERRKSQEAQLRGLANQLAALPVVSPLELAEARARIDEAEAARKLARELVERLQELEFQSRAWQDLQMRLSHARKRRQRNEAILAQAAVIEKALDRLRELREVVPRLTEIVSLKSQARSAEEQIRFLQRERDKQREELSKKENLLKQTADQRQLLHNAIARDEAQHRVLAARLRTITGQLEKLREAERQESELARLRDELQSLPSDPSAQVQSAREQVERLEGLARLVPLLGKFLARRDELGRTLASDRELEQTLTAVRLRGESSKAEVERLRPQMEAAAQHWHKAREQTAHMRALLQQARESLQELTELTGAKVCRHCGQSLTPGHLEEEKRRRAATVQQLEAQTQQASQALEQARLTHEQMQQNLARAEKTYQEAREEYREVLAQRNQARSSVSRAQEECGHLYGELPEAIRQRICQQPPADWLATTYPTPADIDQLKAQTYELESARRKLREMEQLQHRWVQLKALETTALETLNRLLRDLPQDRQALQREHADLESQERALFRAVDAAREQVASVEKQLTAYTGERDAAQRELSKTDTRLKEEQLVQQNAERNIATQIKLLPPLWQTQVERIALKELHNLKGELEQLEREGTEERGRELEQARAGLSVLDEEIRNLEKQERDYPPEAREEPAVLASRLREARDRDKECDEQLSKVRQQLALLENYHEQRMRLDEQYRALDAEQQCNRLLAELLGKDRLQLYLVRQAERQVVEYANAVLDRLSGGQLYLKLACTEDGEAASSKALDLEVYNLATGERPINVAFLSGSQKFRVAVSLALGIGQYASRQHRPIESVIIDEGFGCLDSQGRQVMIQELQNLRSQMRCILLVSHQEDFAESFSDGYQFRLENGATRVQRFQK